MFYLHKYKCYDLIDMLNDTSQYLDDNPEFEKHIPDTCISSRTSVE